MKVSHQVSAPASGSTLRSKLVGRLLGWALILGALPAAAQRSPRHGRLAPEDTVRQEATIELPAAVIDSLAAGPLTEPVVDSVRLAWLQTPTTLQELVADRVSCFETTMPHQFNAAVMAYVRLFIERQRGYTQRVLEREQFYFPIFEKYLAQYNLPAELKYLSVVESALIPTAKSRVGAAGLWQFMPPTAGDFHLRRDEWVDERMHPEKATEAACKLLRNLYGIFHDWELVLAAYNWGPGNVQRVIRRTGKHNFWELYPYMPAETRNYVPTFTAVMYAMTYAKEHELRSPALHYQVYERLDTLGLRGQAVDLRRLSRALGYADSLALVRYNPELRHPGLPAGYRPYVLRFPAAAREHLGDVDRPTLLAYCQPTTELPRPLAALPPRLDGVEPWPTTNQMVATADPRVDSEAAAPRFRRLSYTPRRGQTLATVAGKYDVSPAQLRRWNGLRKDQALKPGRPLVVFVPLPAAPAPRTRSAAAAAAPLATVASLRSATADSTWQVLAAANARYTRQAQERAAREAAQAQALARRQKQLAARAAAQQRLSIAQAAAAAKATAASRLGLPAEPIDSIAINEVATTVPQPPPNTSAEPAANAPTPPSASQGEGSASRRTRRQAAQLAAMAEARPGSQPESTSRQQNAASQKPAKSTAAFLSDNSSNLASEEPSLPVAQATPGPKPSPASAGAAARPGAMTGASPAATRRARAAASALNLETHTVQVGDTLFSISKRFGMSVEELRRLNHLASDRVKLGQKLLVRG